jgi:hypothetical protein
MATSTCKRWKDGYESRLISELAKIGAEKYKLQIILIYLVFFSIMANRFSNILSATFRLQRTEENAGFVYLQTRI